MIHHLYCDESRQTKDRFMVLGGIIIPQQNVASVSQTLRQYRQEERMHAELKWTKVTNQMLAKYTRFVDFFFALNNADQVHFHSIIIDTHQLNHQKFNQGDREVGFYKFYYQLLLNCFGKHYGTGEKCRDNRFIIHPDHRHSTYPLETLRRTLNAGMAKKFGVFSSPFLSIEPKDSKSSDLMQINDIVLGAVGFQKNGLHLLAETRESKKSLASYIAEQAGLSDLCSNTRFAASRFKIWNLRLSK